MIKRFVVFMGDNYYPFGGWGDHRGDYDTLEEAKKFAESQRLPQDDRAPFVDWAHVVDLHTGQELSLARDGVWA